MKVNVHAQNISVSERVEDYAAKKLERLERYLPNIIDANLEIRKEKNKGKEQTVAQLTVRNNRGVVLRAEDKKQSDLFASIDEVVDKMYGQIRRYKSKSRRKGGERWIETETAWADMETVPEVEEAPIDDYDNEPKTVIRRKAVFLTPMSEPEAIDQMELLGHDFFLFYNGEEDTINVLYKRSGVEAPAVPTMIMAPKVIVYSPLHL